MLNDNATLHTIEKWNQRHEQRNMPVAACRVLQEHRHLLPINGRALDVACGLGGNAILLAEAGLSCDALDISDVAISRLNAYAQIHQLTIAAQLLDVEKVGFEFAPMQYDVIAVSYFLYRPLFPLLAAALKPGGLLFYQTFVNASPEIQDGPKNSDFYLQEKELLSQFHGFEILAYNERVDAKNGKITAEAELLARKPKP